MLILNALSDKHDLNHAAVFSEKPIIYLEEFHHLLYQRPFEDQLVSFPPKVLYQNLLVFCQ